VKTLVGFEFFVGFVRFVEIFFLGLISLRSFQWFYQIFYEICPSGY
jgi:hypothetical protein